MGGVAVKRRGRQEVWASSVEPRSVCGEMGDEARRLRPDRGSEGCWCFGEAESAVPHASEAESAVPGDSRARAGFWGVSIELVHIENSAVSVDGITGVGELWVGLVSVRVVWTGCGCQGLISVLVAEDV